MTTKQRKAEVIVVYHFFKEDQLCGLSGSSGPSQSRSLGSIGSPPVMLLESAFDSDLFSSSVIDPVEEEVESKLPLLVTFLSKAFGTCCMFVRGSELDSVFVKEEGISKT